MRSERLALESGRLLWRSWRPVLVSERFELGSERLELESGRLLLRS